MVDVEAAAQVRARRGDAVLLGVLGTPTFDGRLAAVRAGCRVASAADADAAEIASAIERVVPTEAEPPRVLVVDGDPVLAQTAALALTGAGFEAIVLEDPTLLLGRVSESRPDLVLLDMRSPGCTGVKVASVLRSDDRMVGVPVVLLVAEAERDLALVALEAGADDYLTKPLAPEHLVAAVRSRRARPRVMRSFMDRDGLMRVLSHTRTLDRLEAEVALARRRGTPLSLVIVSSTSTISSVSTTPTVTRSTTGCCARWRRCCGGARARAT
jgi:PleD family two-component response regulator